MGSAGDFLDRYRPSPKSKVVFAPLFRCKLLVPQQVIWYSPLQQKTCSIRTQDLIYLESSYMSVSKIYFHPVMRHHVRMLTPLTFCATKCNNMHALYIPNTYYIAETCWSWHAGSKTQKQKVNSYLWRTYIYITHIWGFEKCKISKVLKIFPMTVISYQSCRFFK